MNYNKTKKIDRIFTLLVSIFTMILSIQNFTVKAQSFVLKNSFEIGHNATSLKFIDKPDSLNVQPIIIGIKNIGAPGWESQGWVEVRNPLTGKLIRKYDVGDYVNALDYTSKYDGIENNEMLAVALSSNARLYNMESGEVTYLNNPTYSPPSSILFIDDSLTVLSDLDGSILVFGTQESSNTIPIKSIIQRPDSDGPSPRSMAYSINNTNTDSSIIYAGMVNELKSWSTGNEGINWNTRFTNKTLPTINSFARVNYVAYSDEINSTMLYSADVDSLTVYDYINGAKLYSLTMQDRPASIAIGNSSIPLLAIGTTYDKVLVYDIRSHIPSFIGNYSNQTFTVTAVSFGSYFNNGTLKFLLATMSSKGKVEIWEYIPPSSK